MNEEELVEALVSALRDINDSLERVAQAMEKSNNPNLNLDEYGDRHG